MANGSRRYVARGFPAIRYYHFSEFGMSNIALRHHPNATHCILLRFTPVFLFFLFQNKTPNVPGDTAHAAVSG